MLGGSRKIGIFPGEPLEFPTLQQLYPSEAESRPGNTRINSESNEHRQILTLRSQQHQNLSPLLPQSPFPSLQVDFREGRSGGARPPAASPWQSRSVWPSPSSSSCTASSRLAPCLPMPRRVWKVGEWIWPKIWDDLAVFFPSFSSSLVWLGCEGAQDFWTTN